MVDEFILYDDVQYTKNDWRNRNKIVTQNGVKWITIPVEHTGKFGQKINETKVLNSCWADKHWNSIQCNYARAKHYNEYRQQFKALYDSCKDQVYLSQINYKFIVEICSILEIKTKISWSSDYKLAEGKTERLVDLVRQAKGNFYLSGPAAKDYIQPELFDKADIELEWMDYSGYPEYKQLSGQFENNVSILDLIFNEGENATKYMKSFSSGEESGHVI